jgi:hypothetical protein
MKFIQDLANITKAEVHAFDGEYAVTPGGQEWIAKPGETIPKPGKDYGLPLFPTHKAGNTN